MTDEKSTLKQIAELIPKVAKDQTDKLVKRITGTSSPTTKKTNPQHNDKEILTMQQEIKRLKGITSQLQKQVEALQGNCEDLRMRLNSITDETMDDIRKMRIELQKEFEKMQRKQTTVREKPPVTQQASQVVPIAETPTKLYFQPSADGKTLINMMSKSGLHSNFIELNPANGHFRIASSEECIRYAIANRDYCLTVCDVTILKNPATGIRVDMEGTAEKSRQSTDWIVTKKMKITLY